MPTDDAVYVNEAYTFVTSFAVTMDLITLSVIKFGFSLYGIVG